METSFSCNLYAGDDRRRRRGGGVPGEGRGLRASLRLGEGGDASAAIGGRIVILIVAKFYFAKNKKFLLKAKVSL